MVLEWNLNLDREDSGVNFKTMQQRFVLRRWHSSSGRTPTGRDWSTRAATVFSYMEFVLYSRRDDS